MITEPASARDNPALGVFFILLGMLVISVNDMLIKRLSGDYPLHEIVFVRSGIGVLFSLALVQVEGGFHLLRTATPGLHLLRGLLVVVANMTYFAALAVLPLADASALFFVAPLLITLLSIPLLGEKVGPRRIAAVLVGFCGVVIMLRPGMALPQNAPDRLVLLLPVAAALAYALMQILTRRLGIASSASAMAVYIQGTFLAVSLGFWVVAGDGRYAVGMENESLQFLLRAWRWPEPDDRWLFVLLGTGSAVIGYSLSQAYRVAAAATIAPFEYVAMPLAIFWGWLMWGDLPDARVSAGIALIVGAGLYVYLRERKRSHPVSSKRPTRRW
jgi:S-adenosylmethionine uptake transporter